MSANEKQPAPKVETFCLCEDPNCSHDALYYAHRIRSLRADTFVAEYGDKSPALEREAQAAYLACCQSDRECIHRYYQTMSRPRRAA